VIVVELRRERETTRQRTSSKKAENKMDRETEMRAVRRASFASFERVSGTIDLKQSFRDSSDGHIRSPSLSHCCHVNLILKY
jgi:hypothetical protein